MKRFALTALIGVGLVGCAAEPVQLQHNRSYILEWIGERPLMDYSHLTVTLGDDGRAYGNGGCNHWFAPYTQDGDKLTFVKMNVDENPVVPSSYRVNGIPTINVYQGGEVVKSIVGARPKAALLRELEEFIA